jgi:hypothetical protein
LECWHCKKKGHVRADCWDLKKKREGNQEYGNATIEEVVLLAVEPNENGEEECYSFASVSDSFFDSFGSDESNGTDSYTVVSLEAFVFDDEEDMEYAFSGLDLKLESTDMEDDNKDCEPPEAPIEVPIVGIDGVGVGGSTVEVSACYSPEKVVGKVNQVELGAKDPSFNGHTEPICDQVNLTISDDTYTSTGRYTSTSVQSTALIQSCEMNETYSNMSGTGLNGVQQQQQPYGSQKTVDVSDMVRSLDTVGVPETVADLPIAVSNTVLAHNDVVFCAVPDTVYEANEWTTVVSKKKKAKTCKDLEPPFGSIHGDEPPDEDDPDPVKTQALLGVLQSWYGADDSSNDEEDDDSSHGSIPPLMGRQYMSDSDSDSDDDSSQGS